MLIVSAKSEGVGKRKRRGRIRLERVGKIICLFVNFIHSGILHVGSENPFRSDPRIAPGLHDDCTMSRSTNQMLDPANLT